MCIYYISLICCLVFHIMQSQLFKLFVLPFIFTYVMYIHSLIICGQICLSMFIICLVHLQMATQRFVAYNSQRRRTVCASLRPQGTCGSPSTRCRMRDLYIYIYIWPYFRLVKHYNLPRYIYIYRTQSHSGCKETEAGKLAPDGADWE